MRPEILSFKQAKAIVEFINKEKVDSTKPDRATVRTGDYRIGLTKAIEIIESVIIEKKDPKWIEFHEVDMPNRKTKVFLVYNKENFEVPIGEIRWYGAFRKYAFYPQPNTVYENVCMKDITNFLEELMDERKAEKSPQIEKPGFSKRSRDAQNGLLHLSDE
jgi:hypothetical protein